MQVTFPLLSMLTLNKKLSFMEILYLGRQNENIKTANTFCIVTLIITFFTMEVPIIIETSPLICRVNHWTGFYIIGTSVMKELRGMKAIIN